MLDFPVILMLISAPLLLAASGFFSGSETALFSLTSLQRKRLKQTDTIAAHAVVTLLDETRTLLITLLLGNMVINVAYAVINTMLLIKFQRHDAHPLIVGGFTVGPLLALILLGEVMPKLIAARLSQGWARVAGIPLLFVHRAIGPLRIAVNALIITPLARLIAPKELPPKLSTEEIEALLALSERSGIIDDQEEFLLRQVVELSRLKVRDLMTPRVDIRGHDLDAEPAALLDLIHETRLSRVPVYRGDIDHIEGIVLTRQALVSQPTTRDAVQALVRQPVFVPELQRADDLLVQFRKSGYTSAVVVDEYGGTAGLVTLEDVVEQMVGEIAGPYVSGDTPAVQTVRPGVWRVRADLPIHEWADAFTSLAALASRHIGKGLTTMGGLVQARLGRLPEVGDAVTVENLRIEVETMQGSRLGTLLLSLVEESETA